MALFIQGYSQRNETLNHEKITIYSCDGVLSFLVSPSFSLLSYSSFLGYFSCLFLVFLVLLPVFFWFSQLSFQSSSSFLRFFSCLLPAFLVLLPVFFWFSWFFFLSYSSFLGSPSCLFLVFLVLLSVFF